MVTAQSAAQCDCHYCGQLEQGFFEIDGKNLGNRIIFETANFVVFPTIGQIVEGYLLISPKAHHLSVGAVPSEHYPELELVQKAVRDVLTSVYCAPLFFEHGPASPTKRSGCCVDHAHIHAVPAQLDLLEDITKHFPKYSAMSSFEDLKKIVERDTAYLFYEDTLHRRYSFEVPPVIISQFIRQILAVKLNVPERWDWRACKSIDELVRIWRTLDRLKQPFAEYALRSDKIQLAKNQKKKN